MSDGAPRFVWVDGAVRPAGGTHLSVFDRGFQLGDGIFETLRARSGRVTELAEHTARLRRSADGLAIELPADVGELVARGIAELLAAEGLDGPGADASVRITVSRGAWSSRGLLPPRSVRLTATIAIQAWPVTPAPADHLERGLSLVVSAVRRDPSNPVVTLKTTSRADYVYARLEARRAGAEDAVFLTMSGHLCEATTANIFLVRTAPDGVVELATPALGCAILPGTTRSWLLRWAAGVGLRPVEGWLTPDELAAASEAFMSSSVAGVLPVTRFNGHPIGAGVPGPWTLRARADREAVFGAGAAPGRRRQAPLGINASPVTLAGARIVRSAAAERRMPSATYSGVIQAPPEEVFVFVADAENNPAWHEHVRETRWIDEGPTRLGRRGRQFGHLWGRDWAFVAAVAEWDPPNHVAFQVIEGYRVRTSIDVEPADAGASRVTLTVRTPRLPGPGVDALASRLMRLVTRDRESGDFRRLREALERPTGG